MNLSQPKVSAAKLRQKSKTIGSASGRRFRGDSLISLITYGICSGCESSASVYRFAKERLSVRRLEKMGFKGGKLPHERTFRRFMEKAGLDFTTASTEAARALHMDGKTSRGAKKSGEKAPHIVNLFDGKEKKLVAQEACTEGKGAGGERAAAKRLLEKTDVKGALITADAGFTSGDLPEKIKEAGADYLLRVKDNTPKLLEHMELRLRQKGKSQGAKAEEAVLTGGKIDERKITVLPTELLGKMLPDGLKNAAFFGVVHKISTHKKSGKTTETEHYFISSLAESQASAADLLRLHRGHWSVENDLHRSKDLYLSEDKSRLRKGNAPYSWAALRSFCLSILKKISEPKVSVATTFPKPSTSAPQIPLNSSPSQPEREDFVRRLDVRVGVLFL